MSELQSGITISNSKTISGTLHYKTGFTAFDSKNSDGNFLALKVDYPDGADVKFTVIGGTTKDKKFPPGEHQLVVRVKDASSQKIKIDVTKDGSSTSTTYGLSGLKLEPA